MQSIKDNVAIIGMGCTRFGERWESATEDLIIEACNEAFQDAKIKPENIQAAWLGTSYSGHRGTAIAATLKMGGIPISRLENACSTGTDAFRNAAYAIAAGVYDIALVVGVEKLKDYGFSGNPVSAPAYAEMALSQVRPMVPAAGQFALLATRYFHHYGIDYIEGKRNLGKIAVKNHHNGMTNPKAHFHREITIDQVVNAPLIVWPLGLYDCCGVSDGCSVAILCSPELAAKYRDDYVLVKGLGMAAGDEYAQVQPEFDWLGWRENVAAAEQAYREAGITNPREEIDIAIVHDCFTINELITYEDLGFSPRGKGMEDVNTGFFELSGGLPVNTDGGLKCFGHPIGASGLRMIYEIYKQMQGKADQRQVAGIKTGLTHNIGGWPGAFTAAVSIFGKRE